MRPLRQFDSVVLFAGSTGATFTMPLLSDIIQGWREIANLNSAEKKASIFNTRVGAATRHIRFVWVVKSKGQLSWLSEQLSAICSEFQSLQGQLREIKLELTVYVTCDDSFTEEHKSLLSTIIAPNPSSAPRKDAEHGNVEYRGRPQSLEQAGKGGNEKGTVREVKSIDSETSVMQNTCGPNGTCCCRTSVDESAPSDSKAICSCCCANPDSTTTNPNPRSRPISSRGSSVPTSPPSEKQRLLLHPSISVFSGRPKTRDIIRRSLEQALGESAVVVCGPQGLVADVKQDVCSLSDERAVHKGTGAQGIYLHTESFGY